jgi:hypothetical protein
MCNGPDGLGWKTGRHDMTLGGCCNVACTGLLRLFNPLPLPTLVSWSITFNSSMTSTVTTGELLMGARVLVALPLEVLEFRDLE